MNQLPGEQVESLGFSKRFVRAALAVQKTGRRSFTLSERRWTHGRHLKFIAVVTTQRHDQQLRVREYKVVNLAPKPALMAPELVQLAAEIEGRLRKVNPNHPAFLDKTSAAYSVVRGLGAAMLRIQTDLNDLPYAGGQGITLRHQLQLAYLQDTAYTLSGATGRGPQPPSYDTYFHTLSFSKLTGLPTLQEAAGLLVKQELTDQCSASEILRAVQQLKLDRLRRRPRPGRRKGYGRGKKI